MTEGPASDRRLVVEAITPEPGSFDAKTMATGEPGVPRRFTWRGRAYEVTSVERRWKTTGRDSWGSHEQYVRKHWFAVRTADGEDMHIYCDRQARSRSSRWWLHSLAAEGGP